MCLIKIIVTIQLLTNKVQDYMLELTLTTGTELKIGEDIGIVFRGDTTNGRLNVAVEALREKRIERVKALEESKHMACYKLGSQL